MMHFIYIFLLAIGVLAKQSLIQKRNVVAVNQTDVGITLKNVMEVKSAQEEGE